MSQEDLFGETEPGPTPSPAASRLATPVPRRPRASDLQLADGAEAWCDLAARLPPTLRLGTSSWSYPGWTGQIWSQDCSEQTLSRQGLSVYSRHPLMRTVSVDRNFYRALSPMAFAAYAAQVPDDFRFMVKGPASVCDALIRDEHGRSRGHNPLFLDPDLADSSFIRPALSGLHHKIGALVFQLSPLPDVWLRQPERLLAQLDRMLAALTPLQPDASDGVIAVELRDASLLTPDWCTALVDVLRAHGATYCLGLHARMPPIEDQLPVLRRLWPGPLVCRWNLHRRHGTHGYEQARTMYAPFNRIQDEDVDTRQTLARVIRATTQAGLNACVSISNKAEGCAPLSVQALAQAVADMGQA